MSQLKNNVIVLTNSPSANDFVSSNKTIIFTNLDGKLSSLFNNQVRTYISEAEIASLTGQNTGSSSGISGSYVSSINGISGNINFIGGNGISISISGSVISVTGNYVSNDVLQSISGSLQTQILTLSGNIANSSSLITAISGQILYTNRISQLIQQNDHGFIPGEVLRFNGSIWVKAQADTSINAESLGIVEKISSNSFVLVSEGLINITGSPWIPANVYYLSNTTPGGLTTAEPSANGSVSKPMLFALSSNSGYVYSMRGDIISLIEFVDTTSSQHISGNKNFYDTITFNSAINYSTKIIEVSGNYNINDDDYFLIADTTVAGGDINVILPLNPDIGRKLKIKKYGTENLIIDRNTRNIDKLANNFSDFADGVSVSFVWSGNTNIGWAIL